MRNIHSRARFLCPDVSKTPLSAVDRSLTGSTGIDACQASRIIIRIVSPPLVDKCKGNIYNLAESKSVYFFACIVNDYKT